jgi:hypothetical protein
VLKSLKFEEVKIEYRKTKTNQRNEVGDNFLGQCFANQKEESIFATQFLRRSVRLGVRTPDFHSGNTGSIPVRTTDKAIKPLIIKY